MIEIVDTTCQICGKELLVPGEITHSIEGGDGLSCDRCFYQKAFEHWKQTADQRQELLGDIYEAVVADYVRELLGHPWHKLTERIEEELGDG